MNVNKYTGVVGNQPTTTSSQQQQQQQQQAMKSSLGMSGGIEKSPLQIGNYRLDKTVGIGSFGKVKVAEHIKTGAKVAVKILNRNKIKFMRMDEKIRREIQNLKLFRHPHIIKLYEVIETPTDIFMVMEYVTGGELFDYIVKNGKLPEDESRRLFQQMISGIEYCHHHMVVHRDLKPENLLLDPTHKCIKIADFGLSNMMQDGDFLKTSCGSPNYAAPEVISGKLYAGPEVDVWSCGVILYAFLCAKLPFDDDHIPTLFKKIRDGVFVIPDYISPSCADLIKQMLIVDPVKRISISEIRKHPWFQTNLPAYLSSPQIFLSRSAHQLDPEILDELVAKYESTGAKREQIVAELEKMEEGDVNDYIVAYHLLIDQKKNPYADSIIESKTQSSLLTPGATTPIYQSLSSSQSSQEYGGSPSSTSQQLRKWYLGAISQLPPQEIMREVYRSLQIVGFEWKVTGPYQLRCRIMNDRPIKIVLQLFRVTENRYLLDIKKIEGEIFIFFDICSELLTELNL
ncbi:putative protein serine/threonine kinase [Heterostelium album PN500]|uniref:non-specific serine/threonine protein kinase n=1 Tax=Heterostelium pallidum (strain ATCC 26659 / Pp 5 / PN500) TaxID=670386 RepID=D3B5B2_HETP5|nr:putative protein serine/threonine kinase [Heterostelium album PN500]EFA83477.1 putative protein serine/threonine kinase [Heterostelium album PN500]|eukprot:XP_020435594.1 putative protein serine/threonine kinase [Heterostelium album PN500]